MTKTIDPRAYGYLETDTVNRDKYTTTYSYDILNRIEKVTRKHDGQEIYTQYYYDAVDNKKVEKNERGYYTVYTYDDMNRLKTITDSETDESLKIITQTALESLVSSDTNTLKKTLTYDYDLAGNIEKVTNAKNYNITNNYDNLNRLETVKDHNEVVINKKV